MDANTMLVVKQIIPFIILIAIMYFMLIRPQKKKDKEIASMRASLKTGDTIVTIGGILGKIVKIKDDTIVIQVGSDKVKMEIMKWAVSSVIEKKPAASNDTTSKRPKSLKKDNKKEEILDVEPEAVEAKVEETVEVKTEEKTEEK